MRRTFDFEANLNLPTKRHRVTRLIAELGILDPRKILCPSAGTSLGSSTQREDLAREASARRPEPAILITELRHFSAAVVLNDTPHDGALFSDGLSQTRGHVTRPFAERRRFSDIASPRSIFGAAATVIDRSRNRCIALGKLARQPRDTGHAARRPGQTGPRPVGRTGRGRVSPIENRGLSGPAHNIYGRFRGASEFRCPTARPAAPLSRFGDKRRTVAPRRGIISTNM